MSEDNNVTQVIGAAIIAGEEIRGVGTNTFQALDPTTHRFLDGNFPENGTTEVEQACSQAAEAYPVYSRLSDTERAEFLESIAQELESDRDAIVARGVAETALPELRLNGELSRTTGQLQLFANVLKEGSWVRATIDTAQPDRQPLPKPDVRMMQMPLGPVAVFGASNFPLAFSVAGGDTASALAAGCPVVVKGHPAHPGVSELVARAITRAIHKHKLPAGVFSLVIGTTRELGTSLVINDKIKGVGFTGSVAGGRALFNLATGRPDPIPFFGELGSTNPVLLMPEALNNQAESLADAFIGSLNMGCGQFCTNPGVLVAMKGEGLNRFLDTVSTGIVEQPAQTMLTPGIQQAYQAGQDKVAAQDGVELVGKGAEASAYQVQTFVYKVSAEQFILNPELEEEVFGPCALIVECASDDEMKRVLNGLHGHLTSTVHAEAADQALTSEMVNILTDKVGRILFDGWPTGVEVTHAMTHGGPYPASTDSRSTSVGSSAIERWVRPVSWQNTPDVLLPPALQNANPLNLWRKVNGELIRDAL